MRKLKIIRAPEVMNQTGLPKSSLYKKIKDGEFCQPISLGSRAVGFVQSEVQEVIAATISGANSNQIKKLVSGLVASRPELVEVV